MNLQRGMPAMRRKFSDYMGTVAVVMGLVFVGLEIRQNTLAVRGATIQSVAEMGQANNLAALESPELREAYRIVRELGPEALDARIERDG